MSTRTATVFTCVCVCVCVFARKNNQVSDEAREQWPANTYTAACSAARCHPSIHMHMHIYIYICIYCGDADEAYAQWPSKHIHTFLLLQVHIMHMCTHINICTFSLPAHTHLLVLELNVAHVPGKNELASDLVVKGSAIFHMSVDRILYVHTYKFVRNLEPELVRKYK
jgi:hypothetical protein